MKSFLSLNPLIPDARSQMAESCFFVVSSLLSLVCRLYSDTFSLNPEPYKIQLTAPVRSYTIYIVCITVCQKG